MNLFQKSKSIFIQSQNGDRANYWLQVNDNFDENDPSAGCVFPENQVVGTTVAVKYNNAIAFFTWTGQVWNYDYVFKEGYTPEYVVKKWCGVLLDNGITVTTTPFNSNSPDYIGNINVSLITVGQYNIEFPLNALENLEEVVYLGSSNNIGIINYVTDDICYLEMAGLILLDNDHICMEFYFPV